MTSRKWFVWFVISVLLVAAFVPCLNVLADPFGLFGDRILDWYSYNFTNNPYAAKIAYLEKHHGEYDSYIIGSSGASAYSVDELNRYTGGKFFNLFGYGADMRTSRLTAEYVIQNFKVKNIFLNVGVIDGAFYNRNREGLTYLLHPKVEKTNERDFYQKYIWANPNFAFAKIKNYLTNPYGPQAFDAFVAKTGSYDKSRSDSIHIGDLQEYINNVPAFKNYKEEKIDLAARDRCAADVNKIRQMCKEKGINLIVVFSPMYYKQLDWFKKEELADFKQKLGEFYDFSLIDQSNDARFFYDGTHFRRTVGSMILANIFKGKTLLPVLDKKLSVYLFHDIKDGNAFEENIKKLKTSGANFVSMAEIIDFVYGAGTLPNNATLITFDDGYLSNYQVAYPILKKYQAKGVIFPIGWAIGKDTYKDTKKPITPHFDAAQMKEMVDSGVIEIGMHSFDLHLVNEYEPGEIRRGVLKMKNESEKAYIKMFETDTQKAMDTLKKILGKTPYAYAYPFGEHTQLNEMLLQKAGVKLTFTTKSGVNTIIKGLPQSLFSLQRMEIQ